MATQKTFIDTVIEKMQLLDVTARAMFGEYALYIQGKNFALVCDNTLFIKITPPVPRSRVESAKVPLYEGATPAFRISRAKLNDRDWITQMVKATSAVLALPKKKR
jgi:TfoX/Sxy family transcriptional regulator of competence genes